MGPFSSSPTVLGHPGWEHPEGVLRQCETFEGLDTRHVSQ